jgi:hypothetical protein
LELTRVDAHDIGGNHLSTVLPKLTVKNLKDHRLATAVRADKQPQPAVVVDEEV